MSRYLLDNLKLTSKSHVIIVGGTHGAGKSTLCRELKTELSWPYLTPQEILKEQPALSEKEVFRFILERVKGCLHEGQSFLFEHVMSGNFVDKLMKLAREKGFQIHLVYMNISSSAQACKRIGERVSSGGHYKEAQHVDRRLSESREKFWSVYRHEVDSWSLYDNSLEYRCLLAFSRKGELTVVVKDEFTRFIECL
jgi:predicted ABC-type ATPase